MDLASYLPLFVAGLIVLILLFAIPAIRVKQAEYKRTGKHPKGHYMGIGIAIGIPLGIPIGAASGNIGIGPAIGAAIGVAIGAVLEKKYERELRPMTKKEEEIQKKTILLLFGTMLIGIVAFFAIAWLAG